MKCDLKLWRLEALGQPAQAAVCMAVAANANLVVLALHGEPPSLEELLDWLEDWAANRRIEDAAVTVLGPEADTTVVLRNALERFAWRRGLAFLGRRKRGRMRLGRAPFESGTARVRRWNRSPTQPPNRCLPQATGASMIKVIHTD